MGDIFPYVTIRYCIIMKRVTENFPVVMFLKTVMYFSSIKDKVSGSGHVLLLAFCGIFVYFRCTSV